MRVPNQFDDEIVKLTNYLIKNGKMNKIRNIIKKNSERANKTADFCFHQSLFAFRLMNQIDNVQEKYKLLVEVLNSCKMAIQLMPDFWAALFFRSMVRIMMSSDKVDNVDYLFTIDYSIKDADADCLKMLEIQKNYQQNPYNFMTYASLAYSKLSQGQKNEALDYLDRGFNETPGGEIKYLAGEFKYHLKRLADELRVNGFADYPEKLTVRIQDHFPRE